MCTCSSVERDEQYEKVAQMSANSADDVTGHCTTKVQEPEPVLVGLTAQRAVDAGGHRYWEVVHNANTIELQATTNPDETSAWNRLVWEGGGLQDGSGPNRKVLSRSTVQDFAVTVRLGGGSASVDVHVVDLTALTSTLKEISSQRFKAYAAASTTTTLTAATNPHRAEVWGLLEWTGGSAGAAANERKVDLSAAGDVRVTAKLGRLGPKEIHADLHICAWPELEVKEITFSGAARHTVEKDTAGNSDNKWTRGRSQNDQSPLCYTRKTKVELAVVFTVKTKPTDEETVQVRGKADFNGTALQWLSTSPHLKVAPTAAEVTLGATLSDKELPDVVDCYDTVTITWEMTHHDGNWKTIGTTSHVLYAVLGNPNGTPAYWTLLDYSCRAAQGQTDPDKVVEEVFKKLSTTTGDGKGLRRKRDGVELTYYKDGVKTASSDVFETRDLLSRGDGTARCGAWARFMISTCALHGITTAQVVKAVPVTNEAQVFLVRKCTFNGTGTLTAPFTHKGQTECVKEDGIAGQGKSNPQFIFGDHALVEYGGRIYDPSYGAGPYTDLKAWETAGIAGLGQGAAGSGTGYTAFKYSGVDQYMPKECSEGFIAHTVGSTENMDAIAVTYGVASAAALYNHAYNAALRALRTTGPGSVQATDKVYIPRDISNVAITKRA